MSSTQLSGALEVLDELRARRDDGETMPGAPAALELSGVRLRDCELARLDLSGADLRGADLSRSDLSGARLVGADLTGAILHGVNLTGAELLSATLDEADLSNAVLDRAGFGRVRAERATFFSASAQHTAFSGASLCHADFRAANLTDSRLQDTDLTDAVFDTVKLVDADLAGASVARASFRSADLRGSHLRGVHDYKDADWLGADISSVDFSGAWLMRRHVLDENFISEFRAQSKVHETLFWLWSATSDCGRSLARWSAWTMLAAVIYAGLYTQVDMDWGESETMMSPFYYSAVTFTTLGYGDVLPVSASAQALAMSEVVLGYLSLGGMMSILSDKMARRAG